MSLRERLADWLDIRSHEIRPVVLSFLGSFLVIAFLILARSLREAFYLTTFPVETLPYITIGVALLSVPAVGIFTRLLSRRDPRRTLISLAIVVFIGVGVIWQVSVRVTVTFPPAVIAFYLLTDVGTLLLTSGFWVVTSEYFPIRGAKRLYGLIGAGGTAGAMVMGSGIASLTQRAPVEPLIPGLLALLTLIVVTQALLPPRHERPLAPQRADPLDTGAGVRRGLDLVWRNPHLRTIALIVFSATLASTLLDYQFKALAQATFPTPPQLAGFFGAFYGWTGAIGLVIQLLLAARFMARAGIAFVVAVLPMALLLGSSALFLIPTIVVATIVRGADASLRKSLHRSAIEVLYVPIPSWLRRRTKTFVDSTVDALGEGIGAAIILGWVTLGGLSPRFLSLGVVAVSGFFIYMARRMGREYVVTVTEQLVEGGASPKGGIARLDESMLMSAAFSDVDVRAAIADLHVTEAAHTPWTSPRGAAETAHAPARGVGIARTHGLQARSEDEVLRRLRSPDPEEVLAVLDDVQAWNETHVPIVTDLLARDPLYDRAAAILVELGDRALPYLRGLLTDESADFVLRRRIPRLFDRCGGSEADEALLEALAAGRFEVRYRAASALVRRRRAGLPVADGDWQTIVWSTIRKEVHRDRPLWELQRLLDDWGGEEDLVSHRADLRGELSLKHTFRLLSLVLDPEAVRAAYHGIVSEDDQLLSLALEYLEQALPRDIRDRLWPYIGDLTKRQRERAARPIEQVVEELVRTGATLFASQEEQAALKRILERDGQSTDGASGAD